MPRRTALRYWLPPLVWTAVISTLSTDFFSAAHTGGWLDEVIRAVLGRSLSGPRFDELHFFIRKAAHVTEYAILSALLFRAIRNGQAPGWRPAWAVAAIALTAAVGALDEFHQVFVASRTASPWDVAIDTCGGTVAQMIIRLVLFLRA